MNVLLSPVLAGLLFSPVLASGFYYVGGGGILLVVIIAVLLLR